MRARSIRSRAGATRTADRGRSSRRERVRALRDRADLVDVHVHEAACSSVIRSGATMTRGVWPRAVRRNALSTRCAWVQAWPHGDASAAGRSERACIAIGTTVVSRPRGMREDGRSRASCRRQAWLRHGEVTDLPRFSCGRSVTVRLQGSRSLLRRSVRSPREERRQHDPGARGAERSSPRSALSEPDVGGSCWESRWGMPSCRTSSRKPLGDERASYRAEPAFARQLTADAPPRGSNAPNPFRAPR